MRDRTSKRRAGTCVASRWRPSEAALNNLKGPGLSGHKALTEDYPMEKRKLLQKLLSGSNNIRFSEASACAKSFGFQL